MHSPNQKNTICENYMLLEKDILSPYASLSSKSRGRNHYEAEDDIRTVYQRDRDRILHSKSFRRLKHKTQVFLSPEGDHYRTRLTHTLEVSQIARTISVALRLNEYLTEAIALGHDLGHTPFGHSGENVLNKLCSKGFKHNEQSLRIVELIEKNGKGLNLTWEVRDGILNHRMSGSPHTLEGQVIRLSDKIAYLNHDVDDAIMAGIMKESDLPHELTAVLGGNVHDRLGNMVRDVVFNSIGKAKVKMSQEFTEALLDLRKWMFENIYLSKKAGREEEKAQHMLELLFDYYLKHPSKMSEEYHELMKHDDTERVVCDYISGMTDTYAIDKFEELFLPKGWKY